MITNLFSIFDPSNFYLNLSWLSILTVPLILLTPWATNTAILSNIITSSLIQDSPLNSNSPHSLAIISLFCVTILINSMALLPFTFTWSAQPASIFPLAIIIWLTSILYNITNKTNKSLAHFLPEGTPVALMPSLVVIEIISSSIRPLMLGIRLTANLTAGHLLIHLLSSAATSSAGAMAVSSVGTIILYILEISVSAIQAYILFILLILYSEEVH